MNNLEKILFLQEMARGIYNSKKMMPDSLWPETKVPEKWNKYITKWNPRLFKNSETGQPTLRGIDVDLNIDEVNTIKLRLLEQNPDKKDYAGNLKTLANLARQGHQIMWIIDRTVKTNGFIGRIQDGEWIPNQDRAYTKTPVTPNLQNIPEINTDIPTYVMRALSDENNPNSIIEMEKAPWED